MRVPTRLATLTLLLALAAMPSAAPQNPAPARGADPVDARLQALKRQAIADVDAMQALTQQMIDRCSASASWASRRSRPRAT